jgi:hypothetical protein
MLRHWETMERNPQGEEFQPSAVVEDFAERVRANLVRRLLAWIERTILGKPVDVDEEEGDEINV